MWISKMKLLKLSSDNPKFKTIEFLGGLNIVAGIQRTTENKKTYNGIGKSFSLYLIHLLFGADLKKKTEKEKKIFNFLSGYGSFSLSFEHAGYVYSIDKNFSKAEFYFNKEKKSKKEFKAALDRIFIPARGENILSFRQVFNCFARRYGDKYYADAHLQQGMPATDYAQRLVNFWLLNFGTALVIEKNTVKSALEKITKAKKSLEEAKDKEHVESIKDIKDQLEKLKKSKERFEIGPQFDELKNLADQLTDDIHSNRNDLSLVRGEVSQRRLSLKRIKNIDINFSDVEKVYKEAKFYFPKQVAVTFEKATEFHEKLTNGRVNRIEEELAQLNATAERIKITLVLLEDKRDSILSLLNDMSAFKEYDSINEAILTNSQLIDNFEKYSKVINELQTKESELSVLNVEVNKKGRYYLNENKEIIEGIENNFRLIVKSFYGVLGGSISIDLSKDAKYLFDLDIYVPRDASQGVNEVKVFCYDLLLYKMNRNLLGFLAHDGCIFSELDPRQKAMMIKNILDETKYNGLQYFINMGQSSIDEILASEALSEEEKQTVREAIRLKLYDNNPETWLFGETFG